ncbi:BCCT family transporter [Marinomonas sp. 15G1-11]|uniref:BCCT family transporter n=1 Tax=Marinomonas phaeophyticola TaxID=3004091 RepID=A0ABT4JTH7_9GAMM|nr:BCCT family transporter [Marinomonas sp. 15G1-11]MCZ2721618.1 BCCT family transporter [Marinomonas sp. 15G1-11]
MKNIRPITFWPAFVCLVLTVMYTLIDEKNFISATSAANSMIIDNLSWLFNLSAVFLVFVVAYAFFAPIGRVKIGGEGAEPLLTPFRWFAVSLTTVIAMGILFWSVAEPILHYHQPPAYLGIIPESADAMRFSMSTVFVHWTITPYCIYTVAGLAFALAFHNLKLSFSIGSMLRPLLGKWVDGIGGQVIDGLALFSVILGMSATLTSGLLVIGDGMQSVLGVEKNATVYAIIAVAIIGSAIISAASGLHRGIQTLARINTWLYFAGALFIFMVGPTAFILSLGVESLGVYLSEFFARNLVTGASGNSQWPGWWTVAFFASWFAWAPLTCLFLGKIARGYTVRQFIIVNTLLPSVFGFLWFSIFSGSSLFFDINQNGIMYDAYKAEGFASVIYVLFNQLPGSTLISILFIFACFITFVTAADSNTDAIGGLCTKGVNSEQLKSPLWVKAIWGSAIAFVAWISASFIGVDAVKMLFNLSGVPGMLIVVGSAFAFIRLAQQVQINGQIVELKPQADKPKSNNASPVLASHTA